VYLADPVAAVGAETWWTEEGETWFVLGAEKSASSGERNSAKRDRETDEGTEVRIFDIGLMLTWFCG